MEITRKEIENMQSKLKLIRQTLDIGVNDFAKLMGVSRQTVHNIENHKKDLTQTQYLALSALIDMALKEQKDKEKIISVILNSNYQDNKDITHLDNQFK